MKKLLIGLCALVFLVGSGFLLRGRLHSVALAGPTGNNGEKDENQNPECSPTNLSVGYVDNDALDGHAGSFFPSPLALNADGHTANCGANCVLIGTPGPNGEWDAGVLKIDNPSTTTPLVVQSVTVDIGPVTGIDPWATGVFPQTIPPGNTLMLTEDLGTFDFDTSDIPPAAAPPPQGSCTHDTFIPLIHVTVGTSTQLTRNFADTTQVLNTGGVDKGRCPAGTVANEGSPFVQLDEVTNKCECDPDENGDDNGQNGGAQDKGNTN